MFYRISNSPKFVKILTSATRLVFNSLHGVGKFVKTLLLAFDIILSTFSQKLLTLDVHVSLSNPLFTLLVICQLLFNLWRDRPNLETEYSSRSFFLIMMIVHEYFVSMQKLYHFFIKVLSNFHRFIGITSILKKQY